jgi:NAD(P)-dependent dehydrogenase (short-subunit alcohol dehydrogenase family)
MKIIVVTGASGGIGAALAVQLGRQGHRLVLAARRQKELGEVARQVSDAADGPAMLGDPRARSGAIAVVADVTRRADVERVRDRALEAFDHVDVWVNNAGRGVTRSVLDLSDDDFDAMMAVNVKSALYGMQAIAPHFMQRGAGHIVNVSSFLSRVPFVSSRSAYNAAKAALNALTSNLRTDLARTHPGIHVSLVMPGVVTSDFQRNALGGTPPMRLGASVPVQTPDEAAAAIVRLIDTPVPEIYTNPAQASTVLKYCENVGAFEAHWRTP